MNIQRLRNITTGRLHTTEEDLISDIKYLTGETRVTYFTLHALLPWIEAKLTDPRFWDYRLDRTHTGEIDLAPMTESEREEFLHREPAPFLG